nr:stalk domain-containing protein [Paenibacillus castaneae]
MSVKKINNGAAGLAIFLAVILLLTAPANAASDSSSNELKDITQIELGNQHALALDKNGTVWAWGNNFNGELGDGTIGFKSAAVAVFRDAAKIQAGSGYSMALRKDGTVWYWGSNGNGISGNDTFNEKVDISIISPTQVNNLSNVIDIASNQGHHLALKSDGKVWTWGSSDFGELGRIDLNTYKPEDYRKRISEAYVPKEVPGLRNIVSVHAGSFLSAAINSQGETWIWGHYYGWGSDMPKLLAPVKLDGVLAKKVAGTWEKTVVLCKDGTVWEIKKDLKLTKRLNAVTDISCGTFACAALSSDGTVSGLVSYYGEYQDPAPLSGISNVKLLAVQSLNQDQFMFVKSDGTLWTKVPFGSIAGNESVVDYYNQMNVPSKEMESKLRQVKKAITVELNGKTISLTTNPYIYKGVTFVPLRSTFNELGAKVEYVQGEMTISNANHILNLTIRQNEAFIDGRAVTLAYPPMIVNTMTMVPLRFVIEALDNKIEWHPDNRLITISSN